MYAPSITAPEPPSTAQTSSFEALYRAHCAYVWAVLSHLGVDAIADAHQEVFLTAYRRRETFDEDRPVRPWLTGIARKVAFRHRRSQSRRSRKRLALTHSGLGRARQEIRGHLEARDFLARFLEALPPTRREIFVRGELQGHTGKEIAQTLNMGLDAVYGQLRSARAQLRSELLAVEAAPMPRRRVTQGFAVLMAKIEPSSAGPWILGLSKTTAGLAATVLSAAVAVPLWVDAPSSARPSVEGTSAASAGHIEQPHATATPRATAPERPRPAALVPNAVTRTATSLAATSPAATSPPALPSTVGDLPQRAEAMPSRVDGPPTENPTAGSGVAQQTRRLTRARRALLEDRPEAALALLDAHARDFPRSSLAEVRDALRVEVLCALGKAAQARGEARLLQRRYPDSNVARHAATVCAPT